MPIASSNCQTIVEIYFAMQVKHLLPSFGWCFIVVWFYRIQFLSFRCLWQRIQTCLQEYVGVKAALRFTLSRRQKPTAQSRVLQAHIRHTNPPAQASSVPRQHIHVRSSGRSSQAGHETMRVVKCCAWSCNGRLLPVYLSPQAFEYVKLTIAFKNVCPRSVRLPLWFGFRRKFLWQHLLLLAQWAENIPL